MSKKRKAAIITGPEEADYAQVRIMRSLKSQDTTLGIRHVELSHRQLDDLDRVTTRMMVYGSRGERDAAQRLRDDAGLGVP